MMAPRYWECRTLATKMAVGPSAAPMTAMEAASFKSKKKPARKRVKKMPNCAAAPKSISHGFSSSGPKSIIAPMPMKGEQLVGHPGLKQSRDGADGVALRDSAR